VKLIRQFSPGRWVNTAIYTHGHVDHACGMRDRCGCAEEQGCAAARRGTIGSRGAFDRYKRTRLNNVVNTRQFNRPAAWPLSMYIGYLLR